MSKRKKRDEVVADQHAKPLNDAFAGLAALRDQLAAGALVASTEPPTTERQVAAGQGPKVVVTREKKGRAGKTVTRVAGLNLDAGALRAAAKKLQKSLGCGATIDGADILLQGVQTERIDAPLRALGVRRVIIGN